MFHLRVGHQHSQFLPILARFMGYYSPFWVPERFPWFLNPKVRLRVGLKHSTLWPILASFMDYYSPFWGPGAICTIDDPRGGFMCRSSTLAVLADSGPFHGLLLTILGSQNDFYD